MKYHFHALDNGLKVGVVSLDEDDVVTVLFMVNAGSSFDPGKYNGVAHLTEHMLFKGTQKRPQIVEIEREIEKVGGTFNAFTTKEFTWFSIKLLRNDIEKALDVLSDILTGSLFLETEIEKEKRIILEELNIYKDSPSDMVEDLFDKCLYDESPIAQTIIGSAKSIKGIEREHIIDFFSKYYCAENTILAIAGDVDIEKCLMLSKKYFSGIPSGSKAKSDEIQIEQTKPKILYVHRLSEQVQIALGVRAFNINHPDHYICKVIAIALGGNMSNRLFRRLREEAGLVYDICTMAESKKSCGHLVTYAGVEKKHLEDVIRVIIDEYRILKKVKMTEEELSDVKNFILNKKTISFEDSNFAAMDIAKRVIFDKKDKNLDEYRKKIEKITREDIYRVAQNIFISNALNLALLGPIGETQLKKIKKMMNSL